MRRGQVVALVLAILLLAGCGASKSYTLVSTSVYVVGGEKLKGSSTLKATLTVGDVKINDGTSVELVYAGTTYRGTVHKPYVFWDADPYIFADASDMYTIISGGGNSISLSFTAQINGIWYESVQLYE